MTGTKRKYSGAVFWSALLEGLFLVVVEGIFLWIEVSFWGVSFWIISFWINSGNLLWLTTAGICFAAAIGTSRRKQWAWIIALVLNLILLALGLFLLVGASAKGNWYAFYHLNDYLNYMPWLGLAFGGFLLTIPGLIAGLRRKAWALFLDKAENHNQGQ